MEFEPASRNLPTTCSSRSQAGRGLLAGKTVFVMINCRCQHGGGVNEMSQQISEQIMVRERDPPGPEFRVEAVF